MRPTWAEISLDALRHNFHLLQSAAGSATICAVVKANAYGHGAVDCAKALEAAGAQWFGVTTTMEGVRLREAGITGRILLMTGFWRGEQEEVINRDLTPAIWEWWQVGALEAELVKRKAPAHSFPVHIKVDTGMSRLGVPEVYADIYLKRIRSANALAVEGIFSHLASAEVLDDPGASQQMAKFDDFLKLASEHEFSPVYLHLANSAGALGRPAARRDMVRTGIALYGYPAPFEGGPQIDLSEFRPVLTWKSRIISVRDIAAGQPVGYNATWKAERKTKLGVLPVGYADGYSRQLSSKGRVIVRGQLAPVVGRVSMDVTLIDVTDISGAAIGDEVILLGREGALNVDADEHAKLTHTISYEVLCRIGERVPRQYVTSDQ
jgi:alanine racemase